MGTDGSPLATGGLSMRPTQARGTAERDVRLCLQRRAADCWRVAAGYLACSVLAGVIPGRCLAHLRRAARQRPHRRPGADAGGAKASPTLGLPLELRTKATRRVLLEDRGTQLSPNSSAPSGAPVGVAVLRHPGGSQPILRPTFCTRQGEGRLRLARSAAAPTGLGLIDDAAADHSADGRRHPRRNDEPAGPRPADRPASGITRPPERMLPNWVALQRWCEADRGVLSMSPQQRPPQRLDDAVAGPLGQTVDLLGVG